MLATPVRTSGWGDSFTGGAFFSDGGRSEASSGPAAAIGCSLGSPFISRTNRCKTNICDNAWVLDFGFLFDFTVGSPKEKGRAVLFGSKPPENDSLWNAVRAQSWEVVLHERNVKNREKRIDVHIATDIACDSYDLMKPGQDAITLVAGDGDYLPTIERIRKRGFQFDVIFWDHASGDLKAAASTVTSLQR